MTVTRGQDGLLSADQVRQRHLDGDLIDRAVLDRGGIRAVRDQIRRRIEALRAELTPSATAAER